MNAPLAQRGSIGGSLRKPLTLPSDRKYAALLVLAVAVAYGPLVLINDVLWDDWVVRAHSQAGSLWELTKQAGSRELYPLIAAISSGPPRTAVAVELLLFCGMAPLIYIIIRRATRWSAPEAFWTALLTALVPLNQARFTLVTLTYGVACFCYALSLVLLLRDMEAPAPRQRFLSGLLMVMAFSTNSFLVLAWVAPAIVAIDAWKSAGSSLQCLEATVRAIMLRAELLLLPPVYWAAKKIIEPTYGLYAHYNKFTMRPAAALIQTFEDFVHQFDHVDFLLPPRADLAQLAIEATVIILLFAAVVKAWRLPLGIWNRLPAGAQESYSGLLANALLLSVALALVISALYPYTIVGKPPRFNGLWETRNQTTLMMVSGFAVFVVLRVIVPRRLLSVAAAAICAGFLVIDLSVTHRLLADAIETRAISTHFGEQPSPPGTMMFVLENDRDYRALGRYLPFYELSYLVNSRATGFSRIAISNYEILDPATGSYPLAVSPAVIKALVGLCESHRTNPQFGFADFVSNGTIETVNLLAKAPRPGPLETLRDAIWIAAGHARPLSEPVRIERTTAPIGEACTAPCCG